MLVVSHIAKIFPPKAGIKQNLCMCVRECNTLSHTLAAMLLACGLDLTNAKSTRLRGPQLHPKWKWWW